jgi:hypothetical protein
MEKQQQQDSKKSSYENDLNQVPHPQTLDPQAEKFAGSSLSTEANMDKDVKKDEDQASADKSSPASQIDKSRSTQSDTRLF